jgi:hypothetical protein
MDQGIRKLTRLRQQLLFLALLFLMLLFFG